MKRVAVVAGGPSAEAAVSRATARAVHAALLGRGYVAEVLELDAALPGRLVAGNFEVVFPATHGGLGEDGSLQGLLRVLGLPFVGSEVLASAVSMSKPHAKALFRAAGMPVAPERLFSDATALDARVAEALAALGDAVVVKPSAGGSAIGVVPLRPATPESLASAVTAVLADGSPALVESFAVGLEITCGVLELDGSPQALPPTEIIAKAASFYDFESKYARGGSEHRCPAALPQAVTRGVQALAVEAHRVVGARDLSRVDFVVDPAQGEGGITVLEVNTLPGMTGTSLFPEAAAVAGIAFEELCSRLVERAARRAPPQVPAVVAMPANA